MLMEREPVAALEKQQLMRGSIDENLSPNSIIDPISSASSTYTSSLTPSNMGVKGLEQRKYSSGFDTRKYSSQLDPYRKYSSLSGYSGRSYLSPASGSTLGATINQQVPMIDEK